MDSPRKKIAIVSDAIYPFNRGGKEKRLYDVTTRLAAEGYPVTIYCMKWWEEKATEISRDGVTLHAISPLYPLYAGRRRSIKEAIFFSLHCLKLINKNFDVIDVDHMPHLVIYVTKIVCLLKGKKMIVTWHEVWGEEYWKQYLGAAGIVAYWVEWLSAKLPDVIVSVSPRTTAALKAVLHVTQPIFTLPIGIDSEAIFDITPSTRTSDIIFAGRLLSHKNIDVLIRAIHILAKDNPKISALILGDGPEKNTLQELATKLGLEKNISFVGFLEDHNDLYALMRASRVFVLPSTREGFGIAAIEANACGLPVITIDHKDNAAADLVEDGKNGSIVPLDATALANAIKQTLADSQDRALYHTYAERYNWDTILAKLKTVYAI